MQTDARTVQINQAGTQEMAGVFVYLFVFFVCFLESSLPFSDLVLETACHSCRMLKVALSSAFSAAERAFGFSQKINK